MARSLASSPLFARCCARWWYNAQPSMTGGSIAGHDKKDAARDSRLTCVESASGRKASGVDLSHLTRPALGVQAPKRPEVSNLWPSDGRCLKAFGAFGPLRRVGTPKCRPGCIRRIASLPVAWCLTCNGHALFTSRDSATVDHVRVVCVHGQPCLRAARLGRAKALECGCWLNARLLCNVQRSLSMRPPGPALQAYRSSQPCCQVQNGRCHDGAQTWTVSSATASRCPQIAQRYIVWGSCLIRLLRAGSRPRRETSTIWLILTPVIRYYRPLPIAASVRTTRLARSFARPAVGVVVECLPPPARRVPVAGRGHPLSGSAAQRAGAYSSKISSERMRSCRHLIATDTLGLARLPFGPSRKVCASGAPADWPAVNLP